MNANQAHAAGPDVSLSRPTYSQRRLILFGRYPEPGKAKTRLIPCLGPAGAAYLQKHLTMQSFKTLMAAKAAPIEFCYAGGSPGAVQGWLGKLPHKAVPQSSGHIGQRMQAALFRAVDQGCRHVVLVGTDIPHLHRRHIEAAFANLEKNDVVLGPSVDGGYWLVGLRSKAPIFDNIAWGSSQVLQQTLAAARRHNLSVTQLEPLNDIDTQGDLEHWDTDGQWQRPYISVVVPVLNEAKAVEASIEGARCPDSEIIVVDGGSRDDTLKLAEKAGARTFSALQGRAQQQNEGARHARGRVLLFLHADTRLPTHYAAHVFDTLLGADTVAGAFRFKTDYNSWSMRLIEKTVQVRSRFFQMPYGDQGLFVPAHVFHDAGGFPDVPIAEDLYLVRRLARMGRIRHAAAYAVTSGRRWRTIGVWRATLVNYLIAGGCLLGVPPKKLAPLYKWWLRSKDMK